MPSNLLYLRRPDGSIVGIDPKYGQRAVNAGWTAVDQETLDQARAAQAAGMDRGEAVSRGLLEAAPSEGLNLETGHTQESEAMVNSILSAVTFGLAPGLDTPEARAIGLRFRAEHPGQEMFAQALGQAPAMLLGGAVGTAIRGAAAGAGLAARAGAFAADVGVNAAIGGAQVEGEEARLAGENFSFTDAALAGVTMEAIGRTGAWGVSKAVGGARNLVSRAARNAVATDAERSVSKGGWVDDYRVAHHAEQYADELADLGARDLDTLESATAEVGRQDRKRARIARAVIDNPAPQREITVQAIEGLQRLRAALADELADAPGGPAKRLAKHLDDRIAELEAAPRAKKLWRSLDENRQALQEYAQDLHQAFDSNPGSAWLSREGLAAIDAAEEATRTALLREDAWGEAAARMQREYNVPFHEKWFPARQTVLKDLYFSTGKDAKGFTTHRGEPGKLRKFLTGLGGTAPDVHRAREFFTQYLDGAEAIARAGAVDSPKASREALEAIRRLRKNLANSTTINAAVERTAARGERAGVLFDAAAGVGGLVAGGPVGGAGAFAASRFVRSAKVGHWFGNAAKHLGLFKGKQLSMAELLAKDALPPAVDTGEALATQLADDIFDRRIGAEPFAPASDLARPAEAGALAGQPVRGVGEDLPAGPSTYPGVGQARRAAADYPAGMEAIQPQPRPIEVGAAQPSQGPRGGGGFQRLERPESLRPSEHVPAGSEAPSIREGSEVPLPGEALGETFPAPFRTEGAADLEARLAPGAEARSAEAARLAALTEGEFRHVVEGLDAAGAKAPDGTPLGRFLAKHADDLKTAGLIVAGGGAAAAAARADDTGEGVAGASVAGLSLAFLGGKKLNLGTSKLLGAKFGLTAEGRQLARRIVRDAIEELPPPPAATRGIGYDALAKGQAPEVRRIYEASANATRNLDEAEQNAINEWVGSSRSIRHEQRTGLPAATYNDPYAAAFESAMDKLTVLDPTKHGPLYRHMDLEDAALAELLTKDEFVAGAHMSSSYVPDRDFGPHELRFTKVASAGALLGANPAEMEMVIPKDARFRVTGRYADPETGNFTFTLEEIPETRASTMDVGWLAVPLAAGAALGDGEGPEGAQGASAGGFVAAAALFKQGRARLVADVARRLFSPTVGRAVARVAARMTYTRAELAQRRSEVQSWQENPQELVDRVAEGFRDLPPEVQPASYAGVFKAANFLRQRLPSTTKVNAISMRDIPVSTEQLTKYARYEEAALQPREAWQDAAARGHISPELLETTEELYPDLLAELRVGAYLQVREEGPPVSVQAKLQYARLFGGDGSAADPSMSQTVANMSAMAYEAAVPPKPGGGPAGTSGGVSHTAAAVATPAGMARLG